MRGSDAVAASWSAIVAGGESRCAGGRASSRSAATRRRGLARPLHRAGTSRTGRRCSAVGLYQTVWRRDPRDGVWRVLFDASASTPLPVADRAAADRWVAVSRRRTAPRGVTGAASGADHAGAEQAAIGAAAARSRRPGCRAASARRSPDRGPRWRERAIRAAPPPGRSRSASRVRRACGTGPLRAASEKWAIASARARCSSPACSRSRPDRASRRALPSAARRDSTPARRASSAGETPARRARTKGGAGNVIGCDSGSRSPAGPISP